MGKYGGGLLLLLVAMAVCCGCVGEDSIFSGGNSQTFGMEMPDERSAGLIMDDALGNLAVSQNEEMISFDNQTFLAVRGIGMTDDGRASSWAFFAQPENETRTVVLIYSDRGWSEYEWRQGIPYVPVSLTDVHSPDALFARHEEKLSEYFARDGVEADIFLGNGTYVMTFYGPDIYETVQFDAYSGEWIQ